MIKRLYFLACIALVFSLQACVHSTITSTTLVKHPLHPKKIYILVATTDATYKYCIKLTADLSMALKQRGIAVGSYVKNPSVEDSEAGIDNKIKGYGPDAVMLIHQTSMHTENDIMDGGTFDISLIDKSTKKPFWKGVLVTKGYESNLNATVEAAQAIASKLAADVVI